MPSEIYKGIFVPDRLQTEQFLKSRAHQFLSNYSDVRYANWQTALSVATSTYKESMDSYRAQLKALKEIDDSASRSLAAMDSEMRKLKDSYTTTDEKQVQAAANAQGITDRFNAGQANAMKKAQYYAEAAASRTAFLKSNTEATIPEPIRQAAETAVGQTGQNDLASRTEQYENSSVMREKDAGTKADNRKQAAPTLFKGIDLGSPAAIDSAIQEINSSTLSPTKQAAWINLAREEAARRAGTVAGPSVPGAPSASGVKASAPNFDEQQAIKIRRLHELGGFEAVRPLLPPDVTEEQFLKDFGLEQTSGSRAKIAAERANLELPSAPSGSLIEEARRVYSEGFEQNPYMRRRALIADGISSLVSNYESKGMSPADARNKAFDDLINYEKNQAAKGGSLVGETLGSPVQDVDPQIIIGNQATVEPTATVTTPAAIETSPNTGAFFGNAPDLRDELEQLLAARAPRTAQAPRTVVTQDPRMSGAGAAYQPGINSLPAISLPSSQVQQPVISPENLRNEARVTNRGTVPSMTARGELPIPTAPQSVSSVAPGASPRPLVLDRNAFPNTQSATIEQPDPNTMSRGTSATGSISVTGTEPSGTASSASMTVEAALELGSPFIVRSLDGKLGYVYDPAAKAFRLVISNGVAVTNQPPIKEGDPRWDELVNPDLYEARPMPAPSAPSSRPIAPGGSPMRNAAPKPEAPAPSTEEQKLMELLATGTELADKPMKLNRLLNNTPAGKLVAQLMAANKKARTSQTFLDLREEIYRAYKGKPQQMELAIELLAAAFIMETKPASDKRKS